MVYIKDTVNPYKIDLNTDDMRGYRLEVVEMAPDIMGDPPIKFGWYEYHPYYDQENDEDRPEITCTSCIVREGVDPALPGVHVVQESPLTIEETIICPNCGRTYKIVNGDAVKA